MRTQSVGARAGVLVQPVQRGGKVAPRLVVVRLHVSETVGRLLTPGGLAVVQVPVGGR